MSGCWNPGVPGPLRWGSPNWLAFRLFSPCTGHPSAVTLRDAMCLLLLGLLLSLSCISGLPFYNGFYYANRSHGQNLNNSHGKGRRHPGSGSLLCRVAKTFPWLLL